VHGDLKPENILIDSTGHLKLTDFGLSKSGQKTVKRKWVANYLGGTSTNGKKKRKTFIGTPFYVSPEVIKYQETTPDADWWALGVIMHEMLLGEPPFNGDTPDEIFRRILNNERTREISIGSDDDQITPDAASLINMLLTPDPEKRLGHNGALEIKNHIFFEGVVWDDIRNQEPPFVPNPTDITDTSHFLEEKSFQASEIEIEKKSTVSFSIHL